ncbi:hypothetical protein B0T10DRAFT_480509 [Thelonectria olida]|uniref:Transmembrane protein n=1 Tax=Thelonectria olida TaxID=1576542 RepID=A0A9P8WCX6_9HYPO|nr:hypothetical protein B0T10DRAFT_480509 [Thelonectria olida]
MMLFPLDQAPPHAMTSRTASSPAEGEHDFKSPAPDHSTIIKVLALVSVVGWVFFGIMSITCINGQGRAGRWVPEWYLDARGTRRDKMALVIWWMAVVFLWPVILAVLVIKNGVRGMVLHCKGVGSREWDEEQKGGSGEAGRGLE